MTEVVLSLGSNISPKTDHLRAMRLHLGKSLSDIRYSSIYITEPVGVDGCHDAYLNQLLRASWAGEADELLKKTQEIECILGRTDKGKLKPRTADIDILLFGTEIITEENLTIPHHALLERHFHVVGLKELCPNWQVPGKNISFEAYGIPIEVRNQALELYR